jgi:hypothetical protein
MAAGLAGFGLLALAGCALQEAQAVVTTPSSSAPEASARPGASAYADGTYAADGAYVAPSGREMISVSLTIAADVVTDVTVTGDAVDHEAIEFQKRFARGIAAKVVGRDIADLSVTRVAGSSLTSKGFNTALDQIRSDALQ